MCIWHLTVLPSTSSENRVQDSQAFTSEVQSLFLCTKLSEMGCLEDICQPQVSGAPGVPLASELFPLVHSTALGASKEGPGLPRSQLCLAHLGTPEDAGVQGVDKYTWVSLAHPAPLSLASLWMPAHHVSTWTLLVLVNLCTWTGPPQEHPGACRGQLTGSVTVASLGLSLGLLEQLDLPTAHADSRGPCCRGRRGGLSGRPVSWWRGRSLKDRW